MRLRRISRWHVAVGAVVGLTGVLAFSVTREVRERYTRVLAQRSAVTTAGYLALVTPAGRGGRGYDLLQLLIRARALDQLVGLHARLEIYHGVAPLVHATAPDLAPGTLEGLRREAVVRWAGGAGLAPLFDRAGWDVVGAVQARVGLPEGPLFVWLLGVLALALVTGALAVRALGGPAAAAQRAARRYAAAAGLVALFAAIDLHAFARDATDTWLTDTRLLIEEAAAHLPDARSAPARFSALAPDAELVTGDSAGPEVRRREVAGLPRATVAVRLAPGRWAELRRAPEQEAVTPWVLGALALALLGPLGVAAATWGVRARAAPRAFRETIAGWSFLAPSALHLIVFTVGPLGFALYLSLHHWGAMDPARRFVGVANYRQLLADPLVWTAFRNTLVYALYVPVSMALALGLALALEPPSWSARALRTVIFAPSIPSLVATALLWHGLYRPDGGGINHLLALVHRGPVDWLGDPATALFAVMLIAVWVHMGAQMTVFLAGLARIPRAYLDAARVDGATAWQRFWLITFPLLGPLRRFLLVTGVIGASQMFTLVYVLTSGGPGHATDVVVYRIYQTAWDVRQFGSASALAVLQGAIAAALTWGGMRLLERRAVVA